MVFTARGEEAYDHIAGSNAVKYFLDNKIAFDGIVAQSDQESMGAVNTLLQFGVKVPEQVKIIGIDNAPYCEFARIPLSSVSQQFQERGILAVEYMMKMVDNKSVQSINVEPKLFIRESSR